MLRHAVALDYPTRPVRIIVGFAAGGSADIVARLTGQWLSERVGQQFIIENQTGAGTNIATEAVVNSPPDGYTLLLITAANFINATLYEKLKSNFIRDITPVAGLSREPAVMVVHSSVPANTVPQFIAYAKANPGKINFASGGIGAPSHVFGELFEMLTGLSMVHVPYRGAGPALTGLLGNQVQVYFSPLSAAIEYVKTGKLRALAVTTATRSEALADLPTMNEFVPDYEASKLVWHRRAKEDARRDRRQAQQGDQRCACRSADESADCRSRGNGARRVARRRRKADCCRNRQMGQGG